LLFGACALRFLDSLVLIVPFYTVISAENGLTLRRRQTPPRFAIGNPDRSKGVSAR